ncbi:MAG: hypothetical protein HQK59_13215 [Deltaproteobacteria bacterium]|nr:hypothetical protein [Deltaproteobacteria bacterium]
MEALEKMPARTIEHVKGSELPIGLLEKFGFFPDQTFTIILEDDDGREYDHRELRPEFIEEIERDDEDIKAEQLTEFETATNFRTLLYKGIDKGNVAFEEEAGRIAVEATAFARQKR